MLLILLIPLAFGVEELSFSLISVERFEVEFEVGALDIDKVYFIFEDKAGNSSFATFERKEEKFELSIVDGGAHEIYTAPVIDERLIFTWPDYWINGVQMTLALKQGDMPKLDINTYNFVSSVISFTTLGTSKIEAVYSCEKTCSYYYLIIPFVLCIFGSRYDMFLKLYEKRNGVTAEETIV